MSLESGGDESRSLRKLLTGTAQTSAVSEPALHPSVVAAYRMRVVALGTLITVASIVTTLIYIALGASGYATITKFVVVLALGVAVLGAVVMVPWNRVLRTRWALPALYGWSVSTLAVAGLAVYADGGGNTEMYLLFPVLTVFFAIVYPQRAQIALLLLGTAMYSAALAVSGWHIAGASFFVRIAALWAMGYMASVLSGWLVVEMGDRAASSTTAERRKDMLDTVARAARRMGSLDATHVLEGALAGAVELGCLDAEVWLLDGEHRDLALHKRVSPDGVKIDAQAVSHLFGHARSTGATQVQELRQGARIAAPIHQEREPTGVLVVTTDDVDRSDSLLVECIELLAAQVSAGLDIARSALERRGLEERLAHQAFHDSLTDLPNRVLFADRLELALARSARDKSNVAVLFLDLDGFKEINDTLGHSAGDDLLQGVSVRIQECLRPNDTLARYGGDEFVILIERIEGPEPAELVARRILQVLGQPLDVAGRHVRVSASIGLALTTHRPGADADVVRRADMAMYSAKAHGGGSFVISQADNGND